MFRKIVTTSSIIASLAAPVALAQDDGENGSENEEVLLENQEAEEVRGDWVLGARVQTPDGASIGSIEDLILDNDDGTVNAAIVSVGGFLGFGAKQIAVNWNELEIDYDGNEISLDITREEAEAAEEYSFREREQPPAEPAGSDMGTGTGTGMGTGTGGMGN